MEKCRERSCPELWAPGRVGAGCGSAGAAIIRIRLLQRGAESEWDAHRRAPGRQIYL